MMAMPAPVREPPPELVSVVLVGFSEVSVVVFMAMILVGFVGFRYACEGGVH